MQERKVKLEVHIGRDDEGRWWVIASVDDEEALQHGPYEVQAAAEKEAVKLVAEFENVEDEEDLKRIIESDLPTRH
jgi:DNA-binding GntR family transcriptional regulator